MQKSKKIILLVILVALVAFLVITEKKETPVEETESPYLNSQIEIQTFEGESGWGYDILIDGALYVHQPSIPALPGNDGFETEAEARAVAGLMVQKIRDNILPPGVTAEEVQAIISQ